MLRYRDFNNNPDGFDYATGKTFLQRLHDGGRHYVPIFDAAIYIPNPSDPSDAYVSSLSMPAFFHLLTSFQVPDLRERKPDRLLHAKPRRQPLHR
jgi:hypothetical protein